MTYKKITTTLAIVVIAALMVSASVVIALTITTGGVGISLAGAQGKLHSCPHATAPGAVGCGPPVKVKPQP
jgi:hypothetical protein